MKKITTDDMDYIRNLLHNNIEELKEELENFDTKTNEFKSVKKEIDYLNDLIDRFDCNCDCWIDYTNKQIQKNQKKKKVVIKINVNVTESHTFIIDESYEISDDMEFAEIYNDLSDKFGDPIIEVEDFGWMDMFDMDILN